MSLCPLLAVLVNYLHGYSMVSKLEKFFFISVVLLFCGSIIAWFYDIVVEATFLGYHTRRVLNGLRFGMVLFIVSEIMFFFSFFWAFFHSSVSPSIWIGCIWPPLGIQVINPWGLPLLNTVILLSSGVTVTWAHRSIVEGDDDDEEINSSVVVDSSTGEKKVLLTQRESSLIALAITIFYGILFTILQMYEYMTSKFTIADGIYGSTFFVTTGFHGLHVIIGTIFLIVCLIRHFFYHFTVEYHFGLEACIWYWHFVDVVWLFLFSFIYWWGSNISL